MSIEVVIKKYEALADEEDVMITPVLIRLVQIGFKYKNVIVYVPLTGGPHWSVFSSPPFSAFVYM